MSLGCESDTGWGGGGVGKGTIDTCVPSWKSCAESSSMGVALPLRLSSASFHLSTYEVCCCTLNSVRALKASCEAVDKKWRKADSASTACVVRSVCCGSVSKDVVEIVQCDKFSLNLCFGLSRDWKWILHCAFEVHTLKLQLLKAYRVYNSVNNVLRGVPRASALVLYLVLDYCYTMLLQCAWDREMSFKHSNF